MAVKTDVEKVTCNIHCRNKTAAKIPAHNLHKWVSEKVLTSLSTQNRIFWGRSIQESTHWYCQHKIKITQKYQDTQNTKNTKVNTKN